MNKQKLQDIHNWLLTDMVGSNCHEIKKSDLITLIEALLEEPKAEEMLNRCRGLDGYLGQISISEPVKKLNYYKLIGEKGNIVSVIEANSPVEAFNAVRGQYAIIDIQLVFNI